MPTTTLRDTGRSQVLMHEARKYSPGGVHSGIRAAVPLVFERAEGAYVWDVDGNRYIDFHGAFAATILGHAHPRVDAAVAQGVRKLDLMGLGTSEYEIAMARKIVEHVASVDMVAICNTGSEATHHAIRLSRQATGRQKIVKFQGCYHGWHDYVLMNVANPPEMLGQKMPHSGGVLSAVLDYTTVVEYNDLEGLAQALQTHEYAALLVEPIAHNMGCVMMTDEFAHGMRRLCDETGTVLVYDEVITGFRHGLGGYQETIGIVPDLTTLGKAMSNGYPCAAVGGKQELMNHFLAAGGTVYFSGTLNAHPLGTLAAVATIAELENPQVYQHLFALGDYLRDGFREISERLGLPMVVAGYGSISVPYFRDPELGPPSNYPDLLSCDSDTDVAFRSAMVERGMLIYPRPRARMVLNAAHTRDDVDQLLETAEDVLRHLR